MKSPPGSLPANKTGRDLLLIFALAVFFLGLLPPAASFVFYTAFPEHHYTDAAIPMFRSNELLTPRQHDGSVRLIKPPLTYWLMIGSYRLFGVNAFSSRFVFLLGGCATIWLAYRTTFKLTGEIRTAGFAAVILLSQPLFIAVSIRSLPDILLTFWILLSGYGFIRLICLSDLKPISYWMAYGGAAMAIETKGLLAMLLVVYALGFAYATASPARPLRNVVNLKIIAVAALIGCAGFLLMFWQHGDVFLQSFWGDQVGQKVDLNIAHFLVKLGGFLLMYVISFLPWWLCLAYLFFKGKPRRALTSAEQRSCFFIGGWALLLPITFAGGNLLSQRYVVPALPFLALGFAIVLSQFSASDLKIALRPLNACAIICFLVLASFGLLLFQETGFTNYLAGLAVLSLVILDLIVQARKQLSPVASFSISCFLFWPLVFSMACPFKLPDESVAIARQCETATPKKASLILVVDNHDLSVGLASRVRISSGGFYPVSRFESLPENLLSRADQSLLVLSHSEAAKLGPDAFQIREVAAGLDELNWTEFILSTLKGDAKRYLKSRTESYYTATPLGPK